MGVLVLASLVMKPQMSIMTLMLMLMMMGLVKELGLRVLSRQTFGLILIF